MHGSHDLYTTQTTHELRSVGRGHGPPCPPHRKRMVPFCAYCANRLGSTGSAPRRGYRKAASLAYPPPAHAGGHRQAAQRPHRSRAAVRAEAAYRPRLPIDWVCHGVSNRGLSAGKHGDEGMEEERAPGRMQRVLRA